MYDQQTFQEDENQGYEDVNKSGKSAIVLVAYFLLLAVMMIPAMRFHLGMQGILYAMAGAAAVLGLVWLIAIVVKRQLTSMQMNRGEWTRFLFGYHAPQRVVEADGYDGYDGGETDEGGAYTGGPHVQTEQLSATAVMRRPAYDLAPVPGQEDTWDDSGQGYLPAEIIEPDGLYLSDTFQPAISTLLATVMLFCGIRRAGKSNAMAVVAEELAARAVPLIIFDTEDEYGPLARRRYFPRGFRAGSSQLEEVNGRSRGYIAVDTSGAEAFGQQIMQQNLQVVFNLKSYVTDDEAALVMAGIIRGMYAWESAKHNSERVPAFVFLDEASKWLPQNQAEKCVTNETLHAVQLAFFDLLVRRGGKQGFGLGLGAQRISDLDKRVLQCLWKFLFLQTERVDIDRYRAFALEEEDILSLQQGECFVFAPQCIGFRTHMRLRFSPHEGHTPGMDQLHKHQQRLQPVEQIATFNFTASLAQTQPPIVRRPSDAFDDEEEETGRETPVPPAMAKHRLSQVQQLVFDGWEQGHRTHRAIGAYLRTHRDVNVSDSAVYTALIELESMGYIERAKRMSSVQA